MIICEKDGRVMKTSGLADLGIPVIRGGMWYFGDRLTCPECGTSILAKFGAGSPVPENAPACLTVKEVGA